MCVCVVYVHKSSKSFDDDPQVGSINFHPYYNDPKQKVTGEADTSDIVQVVCSDDILTGDNYMEVCQCPIHCNFQLVIICSGESHIHT